jgi:6-phosphogluconolactonase
MRSFILACAIVLHLSVEAQPKKEIIYVGTYSVRDSKGVYVYELNRGTGALKLIQSIGSLESPTYLEIHPSGKYLYTVNRGSVNGDSFGSASAFSINPKTGALALINNVPAFGKDPCHIAIDKTGEWAFVANYSEGNLVVLPILENGALGAPTDSKKYSGKSINKFRQEQPHVHSTAVSDDNRYIYVSDLGTDKIYIYNFDATTGKISSAQQEETSVIGGAGPRHFAFHPTGEFAYSAEELTSTVAVFAVDKTTGALTVMQDTVRSLPADAKEVNTSADIHTDPKGKFLYMSNRGADLISIFSIHEDGTIKLAGHQKTLGKTPRNFLIDTKGRYLWVAHQNSDNIVTFKINLQNGMLTYTKQQTKVPSPACIKQLALK